MAVEAQAALERQFVEITWDTGIVTGNVVKLYCVNPENGDTSQSGVSKNDGTGYVSYPQGYSGSSEITVMDENGNSDFGLVTVNAGSVDTDPDAHPEHPIVLPPDSGLKPEHPIVIPPDSGGGEHPAHPIELPPLGIWGDIELPDNTLPGDLPYPDNSLPPISDLLPSHPIVIPPGEPGVPTDPGYSPPPGANHPVPVKK